MVPAWIKSRPWRKCMDEQFLSPVRSGGDIAGKEKYRLLK